LRSMKIADGQFIDGQFIVDTGGALLRKVSVLNTSSLEKPGITERRISKFSVIGFVGAVVGGWLQFQWLVPLGVGGLFCHYWLDGRIWTRRSFQD
jgi:hypothetical protein